MKALMVLLACIVAMVYFIPYIFIDLHHGRSLPAFMDFTVVLLAGTLGLGILTGDTKV